MKNICISLLLLFLLPLQGMAADGVVFRNLKFADALKAAKKEKKKVFLDCYTSWCIPCAMMAKEIFPQKECGDAMNDQFVSIKIDMEKGEGVELAKKLAIKSYPTFIIFNADGTEVNRIVGGSTTAKEFVSKLAAAMDPENSLPALQAAYAEKHDFKTGMKLVETMMANGVDARATLREVFDNGQEFERYQDNVLLYALAMGDYRDPLFDHLMEYKPFFDRNCGSERVNRMILDNYRKGMYLVCAGRKHDYTVEDVKKAVMLSSLLNMPIDNPQVHLVHIAYFVIQKDWDGMLDYYNRFVAVLQSNDAFRGIIDGFILTHSKEMSQEQRDKAKNYFETRAKSYQFESKQAENYSKIINDMK
ncbi:MAG: thioredoxin family protein [Prevotella sp.]|nr:thioredoxin family protein [Prevotella sp.]